MKGQAGLWDVDERYARLSAAGDPLERLNTVVAWEMFRKPLAKALNRPDRSQGGRPPYDAVMMFKILVLQALYGLSDEQAEFQIMDRRTFGRFLGLLDAGDRVDAGCWPAPTPAPKCGPARRIGRIDQASSAACIARSQEAGRCRRISSTATGHAPEPAPVSSIPSPSRRTAWDCSSAPSVGRARAKVKIGMGNLAYNLKRFVVAGAECARMRNEAMLSLGKSSNDLSGDNNFTRQNRTAINAEARLGILADITERHVAAQRAAKALRDAEKGRDCRPMALC